MPPLTHPQKTHQIKLVREQNLYTFTYHHLFLQIHFNQFHLQISIETTPQVAPQIAARKGTPNSMDVAEQRNLLSRYR